MMNAVRSRLRALRSNMSGIAAVEFGLSLPILFGLTMYGAEAANMAYTQQQLGNLATMTSDSVSRIRISISNGDVTDALGGIKTLGTRIDFRNRGRVIVSSVQTVVDGSGTVTGHTIRWQRCTGALTKTSNYGAQGASLGATGIGPTGRKIVGTADQEMIFVEIYYTYRPLVSSAFFGTPQMSALSAMTVRERNTNDISSAGTDSPCSTFAA